MKIRTGFVSNSSSSSFVLIGEKLHRDQILDCGFEENMLVVVTDQELSDAQNVFTIASQDAWRIIQAIERERLNEQYEFTVYRKHLLQYEMYHDDVELNTNGLPNTVHIVAGDADYHSGVDAFIDGNDISLSTLLSTLGLNNENTD